MGSKLTVKFTSDKRLIKSIMTTEVLFNTSMPDEDIALLKAGKWETATDCQHLIVRMEKDPVAIIRLYAISNITVDVHVHMLPGYWGTGVSDDMQAKMERFLIENTQYCKLVVQTPQCCRHVLKAATRSEFQLEGILTSAILWRDKIENIVLMSKSLNRKGNNNG